LALALLGGLGILALGTRHGGFDKDLSTTITMAIAFACAGAAAGWFVGRGASKLIATGDTWGAGAAKVGGRAAGVGAAVGGLGGLPFGAVGSIVGVLIGVAACGAVGAGLGLLFSALRRSEP
jgi:hypothetical protein